MVSCVDDMGLWDNYGNLNRDLLWILRMPREEATKYISEEEYDSLPWAWEKAGDPRWEVELIRRMAYGEGDLSVIAKGTLAMMEKFGLPKSWLDRTDGATNSNLMYNGFPNHHGPAEAWQVGMLYNLVYNRDCMIHEIVCETGSGAPYEVTKKVMEDFFGEGCYDKAKAYTPINENKAKLAAYCVNDKNFHDSATLCNWMWPMTQSPSKERAYHGDLDLQADFMTAVTGETYTQAGLQEAGERITQMLRAMTAISFQNNCGSANLRQEHDAICDWVFDKEPDFKAFEEGTTKLDRADMEKAKDLFYDIFGWDKTTGVLPARRWRSSTSAIWPTIWKHAASTTRLPPGRLLPARLQPSNSQKREELSCCLADANPVIPPRWTPPPTLSRSSSTCRRQRWPRKRSRGESLTSTRPARRPAA